MRVEKKLLASFDSVYAQAVLRRAGKVETYLAASESQGPCIAIDATTLEQKIIWEAPGGTMTLCQLCDAGDILATQRFFPVFDAADAVIVRCTPNGVGYQISPFTPLPYVHRFELIQSDGVQYFVAATLCDGKAYQDDWSKPGKVYGCEIGEDGMLVGKPQVILESITKNHGMWKCYGRHESVLVSGVEGVFCVSPPKSDGRGWQTELVMDREVSDMALIDFDNDGEDELAVIEGFHGDCVTVNKKLNGKWKEIYSRDIEFGHALWGGRLLGMNRLLIGYRRGDKALACITHNGSGVKEHLLGHGGPSQISVWEEDGVGKIFSADREDGEAVLYSLSIF